MAESTKSVMMNELMKKGVKCRHALSNDCGPWRYGSCSWSKRSEKGCKNFSTKTPDGPRVNKSYSMTRRDAIEEEHAEKHRAKVEPKTPFRVAQPTMIAAVQTPEGSGTLIKTIEGKLRLTLEVKDTAGNKGDLLQTFKNWITIL